MIEYDDLHALITAILVGGAVSNPDILEVDFDWCSEKATEIIGRSMGEDK